MRTHTHTRIHAYTHNHTLLCILVTVGPIPGMENARAHTLKHTKIRTYTHTHPPTPTHTHTHTHQQHTHNTHTQDTVGPIPGTEDADGEPQYEMDPAKHEPEVRQDFLGEITEAISNGMPLHWPSDEECVQMAVKKRLNLAGNDAARISKQRERTSRDAAKVVSVSNKMARDLQDLHGEEVGREICV